MDDKYILFFLFLMKLIVIKRVKNEMLQQNVIQS